MEKEIQERITEEFHPCLAAYVWHLVWGVILSFFIIGLFIFLYVYLDKRFRKYTISNKRIIVEYGILSKHKDEINISHIRSINISQSMFQRVFNCGDILIGTAGTAGYEILLNYVKNPREISERINQLKTALEE